MTLFKKTLVCLLAIFAGSAFAATLNVDFDVRTRVPEEDGGKKVKNVAIFVLDRSGSMQNAAIGGQKGESRNRQLAESVRERVAALAEADSDTDVYLLPFSGRIYKMVGPVTLDSKSRVNELGAWKGFDFANCRGTTLLYDALAFAIDFAEGLVQADPSVKVKVFGYTDGDNYTPNAKVYNDNIEDDSFFSDGKVAVQFPTKNEGDPAETARAYEKFHSKYGKKLEQYVMAGKMDDIQWRWLGAGSPPPGIQNVRKDEYTMRLDSEAPVLKSPAAVAEQKMPAVLSIPIPDRYAQDLSGLSATVSLEMDGRRLSGKVLSLAPGKHAVAFQVPDKYATKGQLKGRLAISDIPDAWDRVSLKPPAPLVLTFAEPDALSFLSVVPGGDVYVKVGEKVDFSAKASEDATVSWQVGSDKSTGATFSKVFDRAGDYPVVLKAEKPGFVAASQKLMVHVLAVGIEVAVATQKPTVGEKVSFEAHVQGKPDSCSWWVDGRAAFGKGNRLDGQIFDRSGKHAVKARASYPHGISVDSQEIPFEVAAKPNVVIADPLTGSEYAFGDKVECRADVEGDFDKVVWEIKGPAGEKQEAPVVKAERSSRVVFKPKKGGRYVLTATATGAAGTLSAKTDVKFKVARENLGIEIVSPASGSVIELGAGVKTTEMRAAVKGDSIKELKWTVLNRKLGKKQELRKTPVQSGVSLCAFPNNPAVGDGVTMVVQAAAVLPDGEEPLVSAPLELVTSLVAEMDIEAKVDGKDANGREVRFGEQIDLLAVCRGGIDPAQVQWFAESSGNERAIGTGPRVTSPKETPSGENLKTVRYYAKVKLADGSFKTSRKVIVHHHCPDFKAVIKLPKGADGITRTSFGLKDEIHCEIELSEGAELSDVVWSMGDRKGTTYKGLAITHPRYGEYGEYTISVSCKCKNCGKAYSPNPVKVTVEKQPVKAVIDILEKGAYYTVGSKLHLVSRSTGDVADLVWTIDGVELTEFRGKPEVVVHASKKPCEMVIGLTANGPAETESSSASREIRVRYGWWAIVILAMLALLVIGILAWLLLNNAPAGWRINIQVDSRPDTSSDRGMKLFTARFVRGYKDGVVKHFWSLRGKFALMPVQKLATYKKSRSAVLKAFARDCSAMAAVKIGLNNGRPYIKGSSFSSEYIGIDTIQGDKKFQMFPQSIEREGQPLRYLFVALDTNHASYGYVVWFVILTVAVIAGCAWAMMRYAI